MTIILILIINKYSLPKIKLDHNRIDYYIQLPQNPLTYKFNPHYQIIILVYHTRLS